MNKKRFLIVFEDEWNNKVSYNVPLGKIGTSIKKLLDKNKITTENEIDFKRYDSKNPYDVGTFSVGFYDIPLKNEYEEYAGRIMIFEL